MNKLLFLVCFSFSCQLCFSQMFQRSYGNEGEDHGRAIVHSQNEGYIITGTSNSFSSGSTDVLLLRISEDGDYLWSRNLGGSGVDWGMDLAEAGDGSIYVTGYTNSFGNGSYDLFLMKVSEDGDLIWQKGFGGNDWDFGYSMALFQEHIYICGSSTSTSQNAWLLKTDLDGNEIWNDVIPGAGSEEFRGIDVSTSGVIVCAGTSTDNLLNTSEMIIATLDTDGEVIHSFVVEDCTNCEATDVVLTSDSTVAVSGNILGDDFMEQDQVLLQTDFVSGETLWDFPLGTELSDIANSVTVTSANDLALAGGVYQHMGGGSISGHIFRIGLDGSYLQNGDLNILCGSADETDVFYDIKTTPDGGYICVGETKGFGNNNQVYVLKVDVNNQYPTENTDTENITTSIHTLLAEDAFHLYPNPCKGRISISTDAKLLPATYEIYDGSGKKIMDGLNFTENTTIDLPANISNGKYLVTVAFANGKYSSQKLVVSR